MERETNKIHVVLLPPPAFGHMIPFYQLGVALARAGVYISYISTPKNIQRLPQPPKHLSPLINFVSLPLPVLDSNPLPEGVEASVDVPMDHQVQYLTKAFDLLQKPLEKFVVEHAPDWLIIDFITPWAADVGQDCGVPVLGFSPFSAASMLFFGPPEYLTGDGQKRVRSSLESLTSPPDWVTFPSLVAYRSFEAAGIHIDSISTEDIARRNAHIVDEIEDLMLAGKRYGFCFHENDGGSLRKLMQLELEEQRLHSNNLISL